MQALANFWRMITGANPNAVIVVLTGVIAGTTIVYAWVTWRVLNQSRWALLVDIIIRIMKPTEEQSQQYINETLDEANRTATRLRDESEKAKLGKDIKKQWEDLKQHLSNLKVKMGVEPYTVGIFGGIMTINKKLAKDLHESISSYVKKRNEVVDEVINEIYSIKNKERRLAEEIDKELEKQAKSEETEET